MKKIYRYYKRRLVEISGKNRSLYSNRIANKFSYDLGKIFLTDELSKQLVDFLWSGKKLDFEIIGKDTKNALYENLNVQKRLEKYSFTTKQDDGTEKIDNLKLERVKKQELKKVMQREVASLKALKRETEELEKETGRYELFVGYPFVVGKIGKDVTVKAPLLLFPATINIDDDQTASICLKPNEQIKLNKVLIFAYANAKKIDVDELVTDFDDLKSNGLKTIDDVVKYLKTFEIEIENQINSQLVGFESFDPYCRDTLMLKNYCVLGRYPLTNSIYNDYEVLEKKNLITPAIEELLFAKQPKIKKPEKVECFQTSDLDFAQQQTVENVAKNSNMVIYGPPGTGKSQTIVNIITDALAKGQKVLVVSQKKSALDVVFNRLGDLNAKSALIADSEKSKINFYLRAKQMHDNALNYIPKIVDKEKLDVAKKMQVEIGQLTQISKILFDVQPYGLSLQQMYASSEMLGKKGADYNIYTELLQNKKIMALSYVELSEAIKTIQQKNKHQLYYKFIEKKQINPLIDYIKDDIEMHSLVKAQNLIKSVANSRFVPFDITKRPYARDLLAYYLEHSQDGKIDYRPLTKFIATTRYPKVYKKYAISKFILPLYPVMRKKVKAIEAEIENSFDKTLSDLKDYISDYKVLQEVLEPKGYLLTCDNILSGNTMYLKLLGNALTDYVDVRDINSVLKDISDSEKLILKFAYKHSDNFKNYQYIIDKILTIRTYAEVVKLEDKYKFELAKLADFENIKNRLQALKNEQLAINKQLCLNKSIVEYRQYISQNIENGKNFLYQISKQQNLWPIRKTFAEYKDFLLKLFPCWLVSPETASQILPLEKQMFDLVIFDEASQVFVENTLPCIFRGKHIVVAGDNKQLRPSTSFIKRYMGNEDLDELDTSSQIALEVESLLDLATSRYFSSNLTYHYRSRNEELINFSNYAFYEKGLQISPNTSKNKKQMPIERIKVDGKWVDTKNVVEAEMVAKLVCKLLKDKHRKSSIGIITFNLEQENAIEDAIDNLASKDKEFRDALIVEQNRKENGEDISLFVKNLENVQGDERDIIIFSTAYAKNEYGKVVAHFGLLSNEGGENRLNVAITRAKEKVYVVTSIEPEELNVDGAKNLGPKLFREYLRYVRSVASRNVVETKYLLNNLLKGMQSSAHQINQNLQIQLKLELEKLGYTVEENVGHTAKNIPLAIYDKKKDKYLLGIEFDYSAFESSNSVLERDVYRPRFLESRGWKIFRVWSRDWWLNKKKVLSAITKLLQN